MAGSGDGDQLGTRAERGQHGRCSERGVFVFGVMENEQVRTRELLRMDLGHDRPQGGVPRLEPGPKRPTSPREEPGPITESLKGV